MSDPAAAPGGAIDALGAMRWRCIGPHRGGRVGWDPWVGPQKTYQIGSLGVEATPTRQARQAFDR